MFQPLRQYADFQGRARRKEYWLFVLFVWIVDIVLSAVGGAMGSAMNPADPMAYYGSPIGMVMMLFALAMLIPSIAVGIRRLHDTNRSGWWMLILLIPLLGALVYLVFMLLDGTPGPNRFGPDPKGRAEAIAA